MKSSVQFCLSSVNAFAILLPRIHQLLWYTVSTFPSTFMNGVVHFELPVDDLKKAKAFYGSIFGWKLTDWPMPDGSTHNTH
jgi:catechol-2,3-dioxygenase